MRCLSCNEVLTDFESTRKSVVTNQYIDMCNRCYATIAEGIDVIERRDLEHEEDMVVDDDSDDTLDFDVDKLD